MAEWAVSDKIRHIRMQFPDNKHDIDHLMTEDLEFLTLCEDHDACVNALRYWAESKEPEAETRVHEYRTLVRELQNEIAQALEALKSRRLD